MKDDIFSQVIFEKNEFLDSSIDVVEGYSFNQYDTIKRIHLYWNSQYESDAFDTEGFRKFFYNINKFRCEVASKAIDFDTKDINFIAEEGQSFYPVWFFEKEFKQWMKEKRFGKFINRVVSELPIYGSVVVKKKITVNAEDMIVDLRNLFVDPSAKSLKKARYIIERHYYTPEELKKQRRWNNIDLVIDIYRKKELQKVPYIEIFERYGEVPESWLYENGDPDKYVKSVFIIGALKEKEEKKQTGIILYKDEIEEYPYEELHWNKTSGRWLGKGIVEDLFENQVATNEIENLFRKGLWWSALHLYQTRDEMINRHLLSDAVNGEIIPSQSEITPIVNEERNLGAYRLAQERWDRLTDQQTFSYDVIRGERLPAGTPLGSAVLQSQMASGFFDFKREEVGMFIKEIIWNIIIPEFKKEKSSEHILNLIGESPEELAKFDRLRKNYEYNQRLLLYSLKRGGVPTTREAKIIEMAIDAKLKAEPVKKITIPKGFYDNLKFKIDIVITGENIDVASKLTTLQTALQLITANPMILKDPQTKKVFYKLLDLAGISPVDFEIMPEEQEVEEMMGQLLPQGGSIATPRTSAIPAILPTERRMS